MKNIRCEENVIDQIVSGVAATTYDPWTCKLADPDAIATHKLLESRVCWLNSMVDENLQVIQRQIILWNFEDFGLKPEERKPIKLIIFNYGGDAEVCASMVDTMLCSTTPVWTFNVGIAASAGSYIFLAGSRRFMTKRAYTMIHQGGATFSGDAGKMENTQAAYAKMLKDWADYILERTEIPAATLKKKKNDDWYIYLDDCLKYKIATDVLDNLDMLNDYAEA